MTTKQIRTGFAEGSDAKILALRHFMHAHPELSNHEHNTVSKIADLLNSEGLSDVGRFHGTGLYVDIVGSASGLPTNVVVRGDIDALPIQENRPDLNFQSTIAGQMHACGHDAHASAAYGVALAALANRDSFSGTLRVIFQPAEEAEPLGGRTAANEGLLDGFDYAVGLHVQPEIPSGQFGVLAGPVSKSADQFEIVFKGVNSHAAHPNLGVDAIAIACSFVNEVQKLVSRESRPDDATTISIGQIHGGEATNIVCDKVVLNGTLRTRSHEARLALQGRIEKLAKNIAEMHRGQADVQIVKGEPPVFNDRTASQLALEALVDEFGQQTIFDASPMAGADDFGFYSEQIPSVYFWVGCFDDKAGNTSHVHTPTFGVSDDDVLTAARATWAIVKKLQQSPKR